VSFFVLVDRIVGGGSKRSKSYGVLVWICHGAVSVSLCWSQL